GVPKRAVDAGLGAHRKLAVAEDVVAGLAHLLPAAFDVEGILSDKERLNLVEDDADDFGLRLEFVTVIDLANNTGGREDAGDDRTAVRHEVVAAAERARQRHAERHAFDALDLQLRDHGRPKSAEIRNVSKNYARLPQVGQGGRRRGIKPGVL